MVVISKYLRRGPFVTRCVALRPKFEHGDDTSLSFVSRRGEHDPVYFAFFYLFGPLLIFPRMCAYGNLVQSGFAKKFRQIN